MSWKAEHVVLAGSFHRQVGEACNPHAVRESTLNGGPNEVRCKERQKLRVLQSIYWQAGRDLAQVNVGCRARTAVIDWRR